MLSEVFYLSRDNTIDLLLKADGSAVDLSSVTQVLLILDGSTTIDSNVESSVFTWTGLGVTGKMTIDLSALTQTSLSAGAYKARLITIDATNPEGIVWGDFNLVVKA